MYGIADGQRLRLRRQVGTGPTPASRPHSYLRTQTGDLLPLESSSVIIGRKDPQAQIPLDLDLSAYDPGHALSRRHASIGREGSTYYIIDLKSTNGTRLNEVNLVSGQKMPLLDGDLIEFGLGMRVTFVTAKPKVR
jgi:pSer/pThr/pTyr-binding forkhead associated (FHA) protein